MLANKPIPIEHKGTCPDGEGCTVVGDGRGTRLELRHQPPGASGDGRGHGAAAVEPGLGHIEPCLDGLCEKSAGKHLPNSIEAQERESGVCGGVREDGVGVSV